MIFSKKASSVIKHISALVFFGVLLVVGFYGISAQADHANQFKGLGYAYGSIDDNLDGDAETGIGYISFGCESDVGSACQNTSTSNFPSGYGVRINTNPESPDEGKFFGYAWSSNYGWVSFFHDDVASCGPGGGLQIPGNVQEFIHSNGDSVPLEGWARVLNHDENWSGCIRFGEEAVTTQGGVVVADATRLTAVSPDNLVMSGWAFGSRLVGWISFDCQGCRVSFASVPEECADADDPEECAPEGPPGGYSSGLSLSIGGENQSPIQIIGNSTYIVAISDVDTVESVKLIPQTFGQDVENCNASYTSNMNGLAVPWSGVILEELSVGDVSNNFVVDLSSYGVNEIYSFTIECQIVETQELISAQAFALMQFPPASVSISASPNPVDSAGVTTLSWNFSNVQENSCEIIGFVNLNPNAEGDMVIPVDEGFAQSIGFSSWNPSSPGSDGLFGITNFPVYFEITCLSFAGEEVSDSVYITTTQLGCTPSMEALGYCSNAINPIFEEF